MGPSLVTRVPLITIVLPVDLDISDRHRRGLCSARESAFGPPKMVLVLMTCIIKKLMGSLAYGQVQKSLKRKRSAKDANLNEEWCLSFE